MTQGTASVQIRTPSGCFPKFLKRCVDIATLVRGQTLRKRGGKSTAHSAAIFLRGATLRDDFSERSAENRRRLVFLSNSPSLRSVSTIASGNRRRRGLLGNARRECENRSLSRQAFVPRGAFRREACQF